MKLTPEELDVVTEMAASREANRGHPATVDRGTVAKPISYAELVEQRRRQVINHIG